MLQPNSRPGSRTCGCGHATDHPSVTAEPDYSLLAEVALTVGITARPRCVRYRCRECGALFGETTDPKVLGTFT